MKTPLLAPEVLYLRSKVSLEDYQHQTRCIPPKKLIAEVVRNLNYDRLSKTTLKQIVEKLQGIFK